LRNFYRGNVSQFCMKRIKVRSIYLVFFILCGVNSWAASSDSAYVQPHKGSFTLKTRLYNNIFALNVRSLKENNETTYATNNPMNLGFGISHPKLPVDLFMGFGLGALPNDEYLRTKSFDFQIHKYGRRVVVDLFVQDYNGFYIEDSKLTPNEANCHDLSAFEIGLVAQYVFNGDKFSYQAAFNQNERQLKSVGSLLLGGGVYYFDIQSDGSLEPNMQKTMRSTQFGVNIGYSYNWVISKSWLVNGSLSLGANLGNDNINTFFNRQLYVNPMSLVRIATVYDKKRWALSFSFVLNMVGVEYNKDVESNLSFGRFNLTYLHRFNLSKVFEK